METGKRDVPVVLIVANGNKEATRAAYEYGFYNVIQKPIDPASYLCICRNALSMQVMRRNDANNTTQIVEQMKTVVAQVEEREIQPEHARGEAARLRHDALVGSPLLARGGAGSR